MKCQKCGKNEVNFHYQSNVNGCVTETHLCSQCATESGYDIGQMFGTWQSVDLGSIFDGMFPMRGISGFMPVSIPMMRANTIFTGQPVDLLTMRPRMGMINKGTTCTCGCGKNATGNPEAGIDEEMSARRELNARMRLAIENEEFEKAAEIRDKLKALEAERREKCDSETTSQDSPPAQ